MPGFRCRHGIVVSREDGGGAATCLPRPYVIKPIAEGSSVGVFIVTEEHAYPPQELTRHDWAYGERVLVRALHRRQGIDLRGHGRPGLGRHRDRADGKILRLRGEIRSGGSKHLLPAPLKPNVYQEVRRLALQAHKALGCRGVSRADFRYDDRMEGTEGLVCLEVNTQPGMTETSLVPELAAHAGITFEELVEWMVEDASLNR